jgi:hypothetical protein
MSTEKKKGALGWKIYFLAMVALSLPTYLRQDYSRFWELFDAFYFCMAAVGMWAFCWNRHLFTQFFWQVFFWADLVWNLLYAYVFPLNPGYAALAQDLMPRPVMATLTLVIFTPMTVALFLYAFHRHDLWNPPAPPALDTGR